MSQLTNLVVNPTSSVREVMERIDKSGKGIALVLDESQHLIGTVTDGDIRRAILAGIDLNRSVTQLMEERQDASAPLTAPVGTSDSALLHMMNDTGVRQIPLVDADNRVVDVLGRNPGGDHCRVRAARPLDARDRHQRGRSRGRDRM